MKKILVIIALLGSSIYGYSQGGNTNDCLGTKISGNQNPSSGISETYTHDFTNATSRDFVWQINGAEKVNNQLVSTALNSNNEITLQGSSIDIVWDANQAFGEVKVRPLIPCAAMINKPDLTLPVNLKPSGRPSCQDLYTYINDPLWMNGTDVNDIFLCGNYNLGIGLLPNNTNAYLGSNKYKLSVGGVTYTQSLLVATKTIIGGNQISQNHFDFKLAVNGKAVFKEAVVTLDNWADYVFDKDYKLTSLKEIEQFIDINHHLPDLPSEAEVKENGVNLGEMDKILLQKIEELTLYIIEQEKRIKQLENK